jgi:tRNA threonylcarbamoyladenosine biosynthesis protein TsaE
MAKTKLSTSEAQTRQLAKEILGKHTDYLKEGAILFALEGDLGAGKTTFSKGVGELLGVKRPIRSPGYILVTEYAYTRENISANLFHIDLWRVESTSETRALGIRDLIKPGNIIIVEWAHRVPELISELAEIRNLKVIRVEIKHKGREEREIKYGQIN